MRSPRSYVLPAIGAAVVVLALLLLLGPWPLPSFYVPIGLLLGVLLSWVSLESFRSWEEGLSSTPPAVARPAKVRAAAIPASPSSAPAPSPASRMTRGPTGSALHSGLARAAMSASGRSVDEVWRQWAPPRGRPLGADLVGPVPETAYVPPDHGSWVPFPRRDRELLKVEDGALVRASPSISSHLPPPGSADSPRTPEPVVGSPPVSGSPPVGSPERLVPYTAAELDFLFPLGATSVGDPSPPVVTRAPVSSSWTWSDREHRSLDTAPPSRARDSGEPSSLSPRPRSEEVPPPVDTPPLPTLLAASFSGWEVGSPFSGTLAGLPTLDSLDNAVTEEALNPLPPHLRSAPPARTPPTPPRPAARPPPRAPDPWSCTNCHRGIWDFHRWTPCPECARPVCQRCLRLSYLTGGEGRCSECRSPAHPAAT